MNLDLSNRIILKAENLVKHYPITQGVVLKKQIGVSHALEDVSFEISPGQSFGVMGDTGCGKTTLARIIMQLEKPTSGHIYFDGLDLTSGRDEGQKQLHSRVQALFQDLPENWNNANIDKILNDVLHNSSPTISGEKAEILSRVGLNEDVLHSHVSELSPGQRQCLRIAVAILHSPSLIILDEAFSQMDPASQSRMVNLLEEIKRKDGTSFIILDTNQYVINNLCDTVAVMYLGKIIELADGRDLFNSPFHPYTETILSALPVADPVIQRRRTRIQIPFEDSSSRNPPSGCRFRNRCPIVELRCAEEIPELGEVSSDHYVACHVVSRQQSR